MYLFFSYIGLCSSSPLTIDCQTLVNLNNLSFCLLLGSCNIDPALATPHRLASSSIIIKLVFYLEVNFTIKGETQMGSVSNKGSTGY